MSRLDITPALEGAPKWPCCHCCRYEDPDALQYTVLLPGCGVPDAHPTPCILCGQK